MLNKNSSKSKTTLQNTGTTQDWKKNFMIIYIGQAFSLLSSSAVQFSIIWWITLETGSALALTIASVVGLLPQAVIGLFAGVRNRCNSLNFIPFYHRSHYWYPYHHNFYKKGKEKKQLSRI